MAQIRLIFADHISMNQCKSVKSVSSVF